MGDKGEKDSSGWCPGLCSPARGWNMMCGEGGQFQAEWLEKYRPGDQNCDSLN